MKVIICSNDETLLDGRDVDPLIAEEVTIAMVKAAHKVIRDGTDENLDAVADSNFSAWHGGRHSLYQCGRIVGGKPWAFTTGWLACHEEDVPAWLQDVMWKAHQAMEDIVSDPAHAAD